MKRVGKITTSVIGALLGLAMLSVPVMADENINATLDKETCEIGESVVLSIEATVPDGEAVPPQISVEYNPNRLQFDDCSCEYGGGGGGLVTINDKSAQISFTTLSGGEAQISISGVLSEDSGQTAFATASVLVNGEDTAIGTDDLPAAGSTGVEAAMIDTGDGRSVQTVFADEFMPSLFHKETIDYQGQTVECAKFDMYDLTLLYTSDSTGNDGKFMIYNPATSEMTDFRMIQGIENRFVIVLNECEGEIPPGYTKAVLDWNGQTLTAFMDMNVASGNVATFGNLPAGDFFLIYALSSEGNKGWYRYDQNEGTYQRYYAVVGEGDGTSVSDNEGEEETGEAFFLDDYLSKKLQSILLLVFAALTIILIVVVIILAVKASGNDYYYEDDYYGDEEESEDDARKTVTAASYVSRHMAEEAEEDEDDEDDEEDEEEDEPRMTKRELKEAKREEKWRQKEEKRAEKLRAKGYEEATPMDWSSFSKDDSEDDEDDRRRYEKSRPPKYMSKGYEPEDEEEPEEEEDEEEEEEIAPVKSRTDSLPPRKQQTPTPAEPDRKIASREEEQRERQKRLFEQQQRIEEQQQLEKQKRENEQKLEQQRYIEKQQAEDELDEDFQFEFLNL